MVSKTTQRVSEVKAFRIFMLIASLFFHLNSFSQTITDVFPTRVTSASTITVIGTGFITPGIDASNISLSGGIQIEPGSGNVVSDTQLTFTIVNFDANDQLNQVLTIDFITITGVNASKRIDYIKPNFKQYRNSESDFKITEVFTNWNYNNQGYYRSSWFDVNNDLTWPNDRHDLLAFTIGQGASAVTYSTGVKDDEGVVDGILIDKGIPFVAQNYDAYSTNGVSGTPQNSNYLLMADQIDGVDDDSDLNNQVRATVYDVLIDGTSDRGLDMGTGIANFNNEASIRFFSGNGDFGAVNDAVPDLLITQIASAANSDGDVYYYADIDGDIIGTPVRLKFQNFGSSNILYLWRLDVYRMDTSVPYDLSYPTGTAFSSGGFRPFGMVGLKLSDFEIDNLGGSNDIRDISNIIMQAGGSADLAFMAYNKAAFAIKSPIINKFPVSRNVCIVPSVKTIEFSVDSSVENPTGNARETITYQWYKDFEPISGATSSSYTIPSTPTINTGDLGNYKVRVKNFFGTIDLPVTLLEGGTPTFWDGSNWIFPNSFYVGGNPANAIRTDIDFSTPDEERQLIFSSDYSEDEDLVGCDCRVLRERTVTIPAGNTLKLYDEIIVEGDLTLIGDNGNPTSIVIPAGIITFEDDASLVQTKPVTTNENSGAINMKRLATDLNTYDYIYWSSPVTDFDIANIPGAFPYQWSVNEVNVNGTKGDWIPASGVMKAGKGYIKRIPSAADFTTTFTGRPNNGVVNVDVFKSIAPNLPPVSAGSHWNLVGNPYPSAINATDFLLDNTNIDGFVYLWTRGLGITNSPSSDPYYGDFVYNFGDEYLQSNGTGSTNPDFDGKIASGQAFFVQVLDTEADASNITFNNAMRYDGAENAYDNDEFFRSSNPGTSSKDLTLEKQLIWLALVNESNLSSIALLGYVDGATNGKDRMYDAKRTGENMNIYSVLEDTKMTIQGRSYPFDNSDAVALGVDLLEDGIYKIAIDHVQGSLFENETQGIYLEDTYLNAIHDLRESPYSFTGIAGTIKDRFVLRYTADQELSVADQNSLDTFIYIKDDRLYVKASNNIKSIVIYDVTGKQVVTYKLGANVSPSFNTQFQYPRGAYIGVINLDNNVAIAKKLIN